VHVACRWERRNAYKILARKPKRKNHKEDLCIDGRIILEWIPLAQDRDWGWDLVNTVMDLQVAQKQWNFLISRVTTIIS
jgi:hypothetical protein